MAPSLCAPAISARGDNEQRERVYALLPRQLKLERRFSVRHPASVNSPSLLVLPPSQPGARARARTYTFSPHPLLKQI